MTGLPEPPALVWCRISSPVGPIVVTASAEGVCEVRLGAAEPAPDSFSTHSFSTHSFSTHEVPSADIAAASQLQEFFQRARTAFYCPVDLLTGTAFERRVWQETTRIGFGRVASYGQIAARIGKPGAARAVGNALGRNPLAIIVPCHRVIASGDALGGFTGGLDLKRALLLFEGHDVEGRVLTTTDQHGPEAAEEATEGATWPTAFFLSPAGRTTI